MICSTLLPLTPKSLPPFGGQTQPAHVLLKFADSRRALLTVQRHGFMVAPDACGRSGCSLEYAVRVVDHFEFRAHVFGLSQAGLMEADVTVETLGVGVESGDPQGEPIVADGPPQPKHGQHHDDGKIPAHIAKPVPQPRTV